MSSNNIYKFQKAMHAHGLTCKDLIIDDEKVHRFDVNGDRSGSNNGWYIFFGTAGVYGSWKTGQKYTWFSKGSHMSDVIRAQINSQIDQVRSDNKIIKRKRHLSVAEKSQQKWLNSSPANPQHPYLKEKGVKPHGLRQAGNFLLVPLLDFHTKIWSLQTILANGKKRFESGGRVSGLFTPIGIERMDGFSRIVICEGWATGASIHEVMGEVVLCAMNAGNLLNVARGVREFFPDVEMIIAADNDRFTEGNPGLTKAIEAAQATNAVVMMPEFPVGLKGTDYNDAAKLGWRG